MKRRIPRDRRRAGVRVVLGPRDEALLRALARFRIAQTDHLTGLLFRGVRRDTAATRLRKLHDAGFIQARATPLSEQNVYQLGPEGRCWAEERGIALGIPPTAPATHHLSIIGIWTALASALAADETLRLKRFEPDWEIRGRIAGLDAPIVPDAAIEIVEREPPLRPVASLALEVDLSTERLGTLERKLAAYELTRCFAGSGPVALAIVLVGAGRGRQSSVRSLVETEWRGEAHVFPESDWPATFLQQLHSRPLADPPCGKGTAEHATPSVVTSSLGEGEQPSLSKAGEGE